MLGQFSVMDDATMNDSVHAMTTDTQNNLLITGDTMGFLNIYDISTYCFNTSAAKCHSPNVCHKQQAPAFKPPPLKHNFRCHLATITNVELVQKQDLIITTSTDCSIRLWTIQGTYIGTFGQTEIWKVRPDSPDEFAIPDDIRATMTEDQINRQKRKKRKFNPWKSIKNVMTFTHLSSQLNDRGILDMVDNDKTLQISLDCDKSYILGRGYRRTTRPRQPLVRILGGRHFNHSSPFQPPVRVGQECGSILVFSQLDQKNMAIDPAFPCPPNYMKIAGREGLPKFTANGIGRLDECRLSTNCLTRFLMVSYELKSTLYKKVCFLTRPTKKIGASSLVSKTPHTLFRGDLSRAQGYTVGNSSYFPHISDTNKYCRAVNKAGGLKLRPDSKG
eukprot:sb/3465535/